jgi:outer membrane protein
MKKQFPAILFLLYLALQGTGQALMTVDDAVGIALKNNYDILLSRASADIDKANNTAGNAGMLPDIGINATDNFAYNNITLDQSGGGQTHSPDAQLNSFNANVRLDWTVFDGGRMFVTRKKLTEIENLGEISYRDKVMQTLYNVILAYYDVVRQNQQLASIRELIRFNEERVKILNASFNAGLVPKTDLLQAKVDLNVYLENAIVQETVITNSRQSLNQALGRDPETPFEVVDSIELSYIPNKDELVKKLFLQNTQVLSYQKEEEIARLATKEFTAQRYPWLSLSANYSYLYGTNPDGTVTRTRTYGPQAGGTLTFPIFYGNNIDRQIKVARLEEKAASFNLSNSKNQAYTDLKNALSAYENAMRLLDLEGANTKLAKENLTICMDRLRLGQTTSLEVRQAEESYIQSLTRSILFSYTAKAAETKLKQLIATL